MKLITALKLKKQTVILIIGFVFFFAFLFLLGYISGRNLVQLSELINPKTIVVTKLNSDVSEKIANGTPIIQNKSVQITTTAAEIITLDKIDLTPRSASSIEHRSGSVYLDVKSDTELSTKDGKFLLKPGKYFYLADVHKLIGITGTVEFESQTSDLANKQVVVNEGKLTVIAFDRNEYNTGTALKVFREILIKQNRLPKELEDVTAPGLIMKEPKNTSTTESSVTLRIKADAGSVVTFDNKGIELDENREYAVKVELKLGENNFRATATDESGNRTVLKIVITRQEDACKNNKQCGQCGNPACPVNNGGGSNTNGCDSSFANQLLALINSHRNANGKGNLSLNSNMNNAACSHSTWMNSTGNFSHTGSGGSSFTQRCSAAGATCDAENIAFNSNATASNIFNQWKNSSGHNTNMLGSHTRIGIGKKGNYVTAVFY